MRQSAGRAAAARWYRDVVLGQARFNWPRPDNGAQFFHSVFQGREKARQDPARGLEPGRARRLRQARRRVAPGGGQARRQCPRDGASPSLGLGRWEASRQFTDGLGRRLAFARYIPPGVPRQGMPLVVMLHGCRQTALSFAQGSRMNQWADAAGFMVLYPQQSMARQVQRCWRWFQPDALHGGGEADLIAALVRSEVGRHGLDPTRVYIAGLSAGAGMAALVALRHPQLVAALAMHSGPVTGDAHSAAAGLQTMRRGALKPLRPLLESVANPAALRLGMPAIILQGQLDPAVAPRNARQLFDQFRLLNGLHPRMFRSSAYWGWARTNPIAGSTC